MDFSNIKLDKNKVRILSSTPPCLGMCCHVTQFPTKQNKTHQEFWLSLSAFIKPLFYSHFWVDLASIMTSQLHRPFKERKSFCKLQLNDIQKSDDAASDSSSRSCLFTSKKAYLSLIMLSFVCIFLNQPLGKEIQTRLWNNIPTKCRWVFLSFQLLYFRHFFLGCRDWGKV